MAIIVANDYYNVSDWLASVDGADGFAWRDTPVTVNGQSISALFAPSYSWSLVSRDFSVTAVAASDTAVAARTAAETAALTTQTLAGTGISGTTADELTVGTGAQSFDTQTGKAFVAGQTIKVARTAAPTTTFMDGTVTSYDSGTGAFVADITAVTGSGTYSGWSVFVSAPSAGLETTSTAAMSADLTLTWSSDRLQTFNPTGDGLSVVLPALSSTPATDAYFILSNTGKIWVDITDSDGNIVGWIPPGRIISTYVHDRSGTPEWRMSTGTEAGDNGALVSPLPMNATNAEWWQSSGFAIASGVWLDDDLMVIAQHSSTSIRFYAITIIDGEWQWSQAQSVTGSDASGILIRRLTATSFIAVYRSSTTDSVGLIAGSVTPATPSISLGSEVTVTARNGSYDQWDFNLFSSTLGLLVYHAASPFDLVAVTISISGTTLTANTGTAATLESAAQGYSPMIAILSETLAHIAWRRSAATAALKVSRLTVSGSTPTAGTVVTADSTNVAPLALWAVSATQSVLIYPVNTSAVYTISRRIITDGTPVSVGSAASLGGFGTATTSVRAQSIEVSPERLLFCPSVISSGTQGGRAQDIRWTGSDVEIVAEFQLLAPGLALGASGDRNWRIETRQGKAVWCPTIKNSAANQVTTNMLYLAEV